MEESSGDRLDATGNGNTLTSNNSVGQTTGKIDFGTSYVAASSQFLSITDNSFVSLGDVDFTIGGWVYFTTKDASANGQRFMSKDDNSANREYLLGYETGADKFTCIVWTGGSGSGFQQVYASTFGSPSTATWYFLLAWYNATSNVLSISVNNGAANTISFAGGAYDGAAPLQVGGYNSTAQFVNGKIDEMGIWKQALSDDDRTALYNNGSGVTYPFTVSANQRNMMMMGMA